MMNDSTDFFPATEKTLASVPGLSVSTHTLAMPLATSWRSHCAATVFVLCLEGRLRIDIDKPMYAADLAPGEMYTFPPNLAYRLGAVSGDAQFVVIRAGAPWDLRETTVAHADRELFLRDAPTLQTVAFDGAVDRDFDAYEAGYTRVDVLARAERLRCLILGLGEKRCVPWHSHAEVDDTFFCLEGPMRVETRDPDASYVLMPGDTCEASAGQPHFVSGTHGNPCLFLIVQGVGQYNYVPFETAQLGQPVQ
jgi:quercetin dioxygenase-like cupin family protein